MMLALGIALNVACILQPFAYALLLPQGCPWQVWALWGAYVMLLAAGIVYLRRQRWTDHMNLEQPQ